MFIHARCSRGPYNKCPAEIEVSSEDPHQWSFVSEHSPICKLIQIDITRDLFLRAQEVNRYILNKEKLRDLEEMLSLSDL